MSKQIKIQIGSLKWIVKKVPEGSKYLIHEDGDICYGICNPETLTIYIQGTRLNKQLYISYLIHELTHAFLFSLGFTHKLNKKFDEEDICYFLQHNGINIINTANYCYKELF